jgi:hypothetical protein
MFENVLNDKIKRLLGKIGPVISEESFYLAGGTGLALQFGHRISEDLNFFKETSFHAEILLSLLKRRVDAVSDIVIEAGTLLVHLDGVKCSFFFYEVPLLYEKVDFGSIKIAEWRDIVAEKVKTISQRGSKKDFVDVYFAIGSSRLSIEEVVALFRQRFESTKLNLYHTLRSLTYFEDADKEPDPVPAEGQVFKWEEVKSFFRKNVREFGRSFEK